MVVLISGVYRLASSLLRLLVVYPATSVGRPSEVRVSSSLPDS